MWDPATYHRFGDERSRPFLDLLARVGADRPRVVVDLGCGSGELTETLAVRWPGARVTGLDSSPEMIAAAGARGGRAEFRLGDLAHWRPGPDTDVVVTNAALQWVPGHDELLTRWAAALPPGAWLALQVPGNFDAPSHRLLREVARSRPYAAVLGDLVREAPVDDAAGYAARLLAEGASVDAWETTYVHLLSAEGADHPVLRWMEGTALRPVKAALDDTAWRAFRATLGAKLAAVYPARSGKVAFPFRRVFVVAHVQEEK
ncbi:trans-aconitate 2-methyltransferase [Couchioplanes azureus]|uniref:trans-aconitate 2-methyltransferase n=1 Tax=Couchioplanes caeruleus TaxID=56438 RepID=UPI00166F8E1A|nr:trans-aconitate 2-methyltransferase [Couchioplanes caeruleus]GGQ54048.1 trans-aconitate 2-methyltransferase [Couchioplanes caeruleus subsp. azureus]